MRFRKQIVIEVAELADADVGVVTNPERRSGDGHVVDGVGAVGQAVRAVSISLILVHDPVKDDGTPRITHLFGVVNKGHLPRGTSKIEVSFELTSSLKQPALEHAICLRVTAMNLQCFIFILESALASLWFNGSDVLA